MRLRQAESPSATAPHWKENHYTIPELAERWGFSDDTIRDWFRHEPDVLPLVGPRGNERFSIPASVVERVYAKHKHRPHRTPKKREKKEKLITVVWMVGTREPSSTDLRGA